MTTFTAEPVVVPDFDAALAEIREYDAQRTRYIEAIDERLLQLTEILGRAVSEQDGTPARPGSALYDGRVLLGLDGATGARQLREEASRG